MFDHISKHWEKSLKYDTQQSVFKELFGNEVSHTVLSVKSELINMTQAKDKEYLIYFLNQNLNLAENGEIIKSKKYAN